MSHRYALGETVRLRDAGFPNETVSRNHFYEITRLMPPDQGGEYGYRLKSDAGERVARESEILGSAGGLFRE